MPTEEFVGKSKAGGFGDFVTQTDDTVGRVLQALKAGGFEENTLVIFTADNGPEHYAYDRIRNFEHRSMGPFVVSNGTFGKVVTESHLLFAGQEW